MIKCEIVLCDNVRRIADDDGNDNNGDHAAEESKIAPSVYHRPALNRVECLSARFNGKTSRS